VDELGGKTMGIVGYGMIGREVARRARAFGMRVIGMRRRPEPEPELADRVVSLSGLDDMLAESDVVVVAAALTEETRGLLDARRLAVIATTATRRPS
jgi:phosphoglycerate dehydrogenase-like enzyme